MDAQRTLRNFDQWLLAAAMLLLVGGCSGLPWIRPAAKTDAPPAAASGKGVQVRIGGDGFALGDVEQSACTPQQFAERVEELLRSGRSAAARHVERYPDVALGVLHEPGTVHANPATLAFIAQTHDRQCSRAGAAPGWSALIADRVARPDRYAAYDEHRRQFMTHLQNGQLDEALQLPLTQDSQGAPGAMLGIDAWRLTGIGLTLNNRPQDAIGAFQKALQLAAGHPYQAASLLLLLSDAQRRAGQLAAAENTWQEAARLAGELAVAAPAAADPTLWERAAYVRPVSCPWSVDVQQRLAQVNLAFGVVFDERGTVVPASTAPAVDETPLWTAIGHWRLARDEPQAALAALKRAESMTNQSLTAARLRLGQAKALAKLGQTPAATAMLIQLAGSSDAIIAKPATAVLGTIKLQQGNTQAGFNLLRRAVEEEPIMTWPERPEAEADLGLAYLLSGDENAGLRWLHTAQQDFEASGQPEPLIQCLENEDAYLQRAKKTDLAKAVQQRLQTLRAN